MAPPATSTAKATSGRHAAPSTKTTRRPPLRIVPARKGKPTPRGKVVELAALALVICSFLAVVIGQAVLANNQVQLSALQQQLNLEQSNHRQAELRVAKLETPQRVVTDAMRGGLVHPAQVTELPYVPLNVAVATPNVTPAPAPTTTTTTVPAATTTTTTTPSTASSSASTSPSGASTTP